MKADKGKKHNYPVTLYSEVLTNELCCYGCGRQGRYISVTNKKICCSIHPNKCPAKIQKIAYKKSQVDPITGKTAHQVAAEKSLKTRIKLGITKTSQIKGHQTRLKNGSYNNTAKKMREYWLKEPWANRLRANFKKYKTTNIPFQGTYEFSFLESLEQKYGLEWIQNNVKRGTPLWYESATGKKRLYLPDFLIKNTLYEIKSLYTWKRDFENNKRKLDEALNRGYNVILVLNKNEFNYTTTTAINMDGEISTS